MLLGPILLLAAALGTTGPATAGLALARQPEPAAPVTLLAQGAVTPPAPPAERLARDVAALVGAPLSPLLMLGVLGLAEWSAARGAGTAPLPWHARPWFWGSALVLTLLFWLSDKVPGLRQALKPIRLYESKVTGLFAALVVVERLASDARSALGPLVAGAVELAVPAAWAQAGAPGAGQAGAAASGAAYALAWLLGLGVAGAVWLLGHSVQVLSLLNPFAPLDWLARTARLAAVGLPFGAAAASPWLGYAIAAAYALAALALAGWSFRWMVFGAVFATDLLLSRDASPGGAGALAFGGRALAGVPRRQLGRVARAGAGLAFTWRPWLVGRVRRVPLPAPEAVGQGWFHAVLLGSGRALLARFPPRYRARGAALGVELGLPVVAVGPGAGLQGALAWLRGDLGAPGPSA